MTIPAHDTVHGLGNRKNKVFNDIVEAGGVQPYEGSVRFIDAALARGLKLAVVSSSRNAPAVLKAAGLSGLLPGGGRRRRRRRPKGCPASPARPPTNTPPGSWTCPARTASWWRTPSPASRPAARETSAR